MKKLTSALVADRTNAQRAAEAAPLADPSQPGTSPALFGVGTAPPPPAPGAAPKASSAPAQAGTPPAASVSVPAVTAPAAPPAPAPRKPVQSAPLDAPPAAQPAAAAPSPAVTAVPAQAPPPAAAPVQAAQAAPPPTLPSGPPPRPAAAPPPPPPPAQPAPMPVAAGAVSATIVFPEGTTALSAPAAEEVKAFAAKRGNAVIAVIGYGDAPGGDPAAQNAALTLGLTRAQSLFEALRADGVPAEAIRVNAEASGRGATLRLLQ
jgi:outer membrane protein OmpA-like peptidoglycan-associated protein